MQLVPTVGFIVVAIGTNSRLHFFGAAALPFMSLVCFAGTIRWGRTNPNQLICLCFFSRPDRNQPRLLSRGRPLPSNTIWGGTFCAGAPVVGQVSFGEGDTVRLSCKKSEYWVFAYTRCATQVALSASLRGGRQRFILFGITAAPGFGPNLRSGLHYVGGRDVPYWLWASTCCCLYRFAIIFPPNWPTNSLHWPAFAVSNTCLATV